MSVSGGADIITDALILSLDAANNKSYPRSGNIWYDLSNNKNNFTLLDGPAFDSPNMGSFFFNGSYAYLQSKPILNFGTGDFSVSFWINSFGQYADYPAIFSASSGWYQDTFKICMVADNNQRVGFEHNSGNSFTSTFELVFNTWYHVVIFRRGGVFYMYINGILNNSVSDANAVNLGDGGTVIGGGNWDGESGYFHGKLNGFCVYNRALSPPEILQNYNATKSRFFL